MPERVVFEYAILRLVPRIERGECINVGVVLFCRSRRFLDAGIQIDSQRIKAFAPQLDLESVIEQLNTIPLVCAGGKAAGPIGELPAPERFRWLVAPRSTIIQCSPVHMGLCVDPGAELARLVAQLVGIA
jgi:hypothetical protein